MVHFIPLCSGSSGNAAYLGTQKEGVLIDAGSSCKAILAGLSQSGIESSAVRAILITHEHSDHIKALKVLCKKLPVPVWSMPQTLSLLERWEAVPQQTALFALEDEFVLAGMRIHPFSIEHDAVQPVGFRFELGERTVGFATDLGVVTDSVRQQLTGCDLVMLEANYEPSMLSVSPYPYHLKQRVASRLGHLSNIDAATVLRSWWQAVPVGWCLDI